MMKHVVIFTLLLTTFCSMAKATTEIDKLNQQAIALIDEDLGAAESLINKLLQEYPNNHLTLFYCGRIMGRQAGLAFFKALSYAEKSLACMEKAVLLAPDNITYRKGLVNFYLGAPAIAGGSEERAFKQVEEIMLRDKTQGFIAELAFYKQTKSSKELEKKLLSFEQTPANVALIAYELGLLYQQNKDFDNAHQQFLKALNNSDAMSSLKLNILYQLGRNAVFSKTNIQLGIEALTNYSKSELNTSLPSLYWAYYRLSQLYELSNNTEGYNKYRRLARKTDDEQLIKLLKR